MQSRHVCLQAAVGVLTGVGAVPCAEGDESDDSSDPDAAGDAVSFSALSGSTFGGQSRTSSGMSAIQVCLASCPAVVRRPHWSYCRKPSPYPVPYPYLAAGITRKGCPWQGSLFVWSLAGACAVLPISTEASRLLTLGACGACR